MANPIAMLKEVFPEELPYAAPNPTPRAAPMPIPIPFPDFLVFISAIIKVSTVTFLLSV